MKKITFIVVCLQTEFKKCKVLDITLFFDFWKVDIENKDNLAFPSKGSMLSFSIVYAIFFSLQYVHIKVHNKVK